MFAHVWVLLMFALPMIIGIIYTSLRQAPRVQQQQRASAVQPPPPFVLGARDALTHARTVLVVRGDETGASFDEDLRLWVRGAFPHGNLHWAPPAAPTDARWGDVVVVAEADGTSALAWPHVHVVWVVADPEAPAVRAWTQRDGDARARAVVAHAVAPLVSSEDDTDLRPRVPREPALVVRYVAAERRFLRS